MIQTMTVTSPDGAVAAARVAGDGPETLIFVHGVGSTAKVWDTQLQRFSARYRCAAVELRGNGIPKPEPDPSLIRREGYAHDVLAVADALGAQTFTIVGCSLGGVVAFELWEQAPERIKAMVIVGSFALYPDAEAYAKRVIEGALAAGSMPVFAQQRADALKVPSGAVEDFVGQMGCKTLDSYIAATRATWTGDYRQVLPSISVPVLVCCGERDFVAPLALSEDIHRGIPGSVLHVIGNAGHVANADAPAAFGELLDDFLEGHADSTHSAQRRTSP